MERTLCLICPAAVKAGRAAAIEEAIRADSFAVLARTETTLTADQAADFYEPVEGEPHFSALCAYISSGPLVVLALGKVGAVALLCELAGPTDYDAACASAPDSLRARFGSAAGQVTPAVHASADAAAAHAELKFFFPRTFSREVSVVVAPEGDAVFAAAKKEGFLTLATLELRLTEARARVLAAGAADPSAEVAALTAGPLSAALLERPFAVEEIAQLRTPTTAHASASPTAAALEAAGLFGEGVLSDVSTTFAFVKPDAFAHAAAILAAAEASGFQVLASAALTLSRAQAEAFYAEHVGKPFFDGLVEFMTSGPALALVLQRTQAIAAWRSLIGPTDSGKARAEAPPSLRARFGTDGRRNACHGSDSAASAAREASFFFPQLDALQTTLALLSPDGGAAAVAAAVAAAAAAGLLVTGRVETALTVARAGDFLDLLGDDAPPLAAAPPPAAPLISAYVPGLALQLFNPTASPLPLDGYALQLGADRSVPLTPGKVVPARGVFVCHAGVASLALPASPDHAQQVDWLTEARSVALLRGGATIDLVGSFAPGAQTEPWAVAGTAQATASYTLVRKPAVTAGDARPWGDATLSSQGTSAATSEWSLLPTGGTPLGGLHTLAALAHGGDRAVWTPPPPPPGSFEAHVAHLTSGTVVALALTGKGAVARWGALLGPSSPIEAMVRSPGCLRARFGADATRLVGYAPNSAAAAFTQLKMFFPGAAAEPLPSPKEARAFVGASLMPTLTAGLVELCQAKPANPTVWLANWLIANNPNTPALE